MTPPNVNRPGRHGHFGRHTNATPAILDPLAGLRALQARRAAVAASVSITPTPDPCNVSAPVPDPPPLGTPDMPINRFSSAAAVPVHGERRPPEDLVEQDEDARPIKKAKANNTIVSIGLSPGTTDSDDAL